MSIPIWILLLTEAVVVMKCAPKLGHVLFDPLSYEAQKFETVKSLLNEFIHADKQQDSTSTTQEETTPEPVTETIKTTRLVQMTESTTLNTTLFEVNNRSINHIKILDLLKVLKNAQSRFRRQKALSESLRTDDIAETEYKEPCVEYEYNGKLCKIINNRLLCGYNKNKGELKQDEDIDMGNRCRLRNERLECGYQQGPWNPRRPPARDEIVHEDETRLSKPGNIPVPKLRTEERYNISGKISETANSDNKIETIIQTMIDSMPKLVIIAESATIKMTTESKQELVRSETTTFSTPKLMTTTEKTIEFIPEITTTQQTTYFTPKLESTSATTSTKDPITTSHLTDSKGPPEISKVVKMSPVILASKLRRSVAENENPTAQSESSKTNQKPKRYCVEKGDRIVCYYTKNY